MYYYYYFFFAGLGLRCCTDFSIIAVSGGFSLWCLLLLQSVGSRTLGLQ